MTEAETFEPACFTDFKVGDRIRFVSANNGFGQTGEDVIRTGTVTRITEKTITVDCDWNTYGARAMIRRVDWDARCPTRAAATRTPYAPHAVQIVDSGDIVTAVWSADPAMTGTEALDKVLNRNLEIEIVAEATRYTRREGAMFSGWIVRSGLTHTDPIPTRRAAMAAMRDQINTYFTR
jgi:hypothetical protein